VKTLAKMHQRGIGKATKVDMEKAIAWYKRAANAGDFESAKELGEIYDYGRGVEVDKSKAVRWYEKALEAGEEEIRREDEGELFCVSGTKEDKKETMAMIMLRLSEMYAAGIGTPVDEERAATLKARANAERQVSEGTLKKLFQFIGRVCRGWN
ncbi:MAG: sel1 repeat family protein, partial [Schwartzia sp.]|nr:sel1 repeat family protein [Schwartzia sp. (in: firmicutes)]